MTEHAQEFTEFFRQAWGVAPFAWQVRLVEQVLNDGTWPGVIDLPTGVGKTATLDIAVYTLSVRPEVFPRRIAFVVDRRLIVDQTATRARHLASVLHSGGAGATGAVADRLRALSSSGVPLDVDRLRGGGLVADALPAHWLRWPDQPAVIVSTVDQFGSRLLFRGYGVSKGMWPVHAGLAGNDCLVLLDEVQLSAAFAETLADIADLDTVRGLPRRSQLVQVSATPVGSSSRRFELDGRDLEPTSDIAERVGATKSARLVRIGSARQTSDIALAEASVALVNQLGVESGVIGFVVNRVASARAVAVALNAHWPADEVVLLTGRMRGHERAAASKAAIGAADPERRVPDGRTAIVATQCIEVGADLSFDAMVAEVAPRASLRQRFGGLDRRGLLAASGRTSAALVVGVESVVSAPVDPVYGRALRECWSAMVDQFGDDEFDVGPLSADLRSLPEAADVPAAVPQVLLPAHLDLLSYTNPEPQRSPDVSRFLHGFVDADADVSVLWRSDLEGSTLAEVQRTLQLMPPASAEVINVPIGGVRRWLTAAPPMEIADVDQPSPETIDEEGPAPAWRWRDGEASAADPRTLRPGDTVVVPSSLGGLVDGVWAPSSSEPVVDVLEAAASAEDRLVVRWMGGVDTDDEMTEFLRRSEDALDASELVDADRKALASERPVEYRPGRWARISFRRRDAATLDGDDHTNSFLGTPVPLHSHLQGVGDLAAEIAERCGLAPELVSDLRLAGELHDLGKLDPRFQVWLHGSEVEAAIAVEPLAKGRAPYRRSWRGGYPEGARHEYLSAELVRSSSELLAEAHDPDLVLHLVTTHHGYARPLSVIADDAEAIDVEAVVRNRQLVANTAGPGTAIGAASLERFTSVVNRYGWHGAAWLEAMLRLADHRRSELEASR